MRQQGLVRELWAFTQARRKYWLVPLLLVLLLAAATLVFAEGSVLAPFIYSVF